MKINIIILIISMLLLFNCKLDEHLRVTKVQTGSVEELGINTAKISAIFIDLSGNITDFGHCWDTLKMPTINNKKTVVNGTAQKEKYFSDLTDLKADKHYFARAYALDNNQPIYGEQIEFKTDKPKKIIIIEPKQDTIWRIGTEYIIKWKDNIEDKVIIELLKSGEKVAEITSNDPNDSIYKYTPKEGLTEGNDYSVRITSIKDANTTVTSQYFQILKAFFININKPTSTDVWQIGTKQDIVWNDNINENVDIELFKGTVSQGKIFANTSSDGTELWTIQTNLITGSDYSIKITCVENPAISSQSQAFQIMTAPYITVTSPVASDHWIGGEIRTITWNDNVSENVNILIYKGGAWSTLKSNISGNQCSWTIENNYIYPNTYKIKVVSVNGSPYGESPLFKLSEPNYRPGTITDKFNITHQIVKIGTQWWMKENLKAEKYVTGVGINGASFYNKDTYGMLYTKSAITDGQLCPTGWHVPTDAEWKTMELYLGMSSTEVEKEDFRGVNEGGKLKASSSWITSDTSKVSSSEGFSALPGGFKSTSSFEGIGTDAYFWTSSTKSYLVYVNKLPVIQTRNVYRRLKAESSQIGYFASTSGSYSVRCLKD